jgi:signal transduction histidine kinase
MGSLLCIPVSPLDETDPASAGAASGGAERAGVGWPLVERRRTSLEAATRPAALVMWPFRLVALAASVYRARGLVDDPDPGGLIALGIAVVVTAIACWPAAPPASDQPASTRVVAELLVLLGAVVASGAWSSPVAPMLVPAGMAAGVALGARAALIGMAAVATIVSAQHIALDPSRGAAEQSLVWSCLVAVPTYLCGLIRQASASASRQREQAIAKVSQLAEANTLLFALQRLAQTLPASLDLDDVVDSTLDQVQGLVPCDTVALYLTNDTDRTFERYRSRGAPVIDAIDPALAPATIRTALDAPRTILLSRLDPSVALSEGANSALYTALRARGTVVGLLVVEALGQAPFDAQHAEVVHGLAEPFGIAIDNARLFRRIRATSADEERNRIARDLHDRVGSSLAFLGFELDRARARTDHDDAMAEALDELRRHLTDVVRDVRETLHDLRSDVTDERPLAEVLRVHLHRIDERSDLATRLEVDVLVRPPIAVERELWRIALEAMTNVERHGRADVLSVSYRADEARVVLEIRDDGVGFNPTDRRADSYGMTGMRERADTIGAIVRVESTVGAGSTITVELDRRSGDPR